MGGKLWGALQTHGTIRTPWQCMRARPPAHQAPSGQPQQQQTQDQRQIRNQQQPTGPPPAPHPQLTVTSCVQLEASGMRASTSPMVLQVALKPGPTRRLGEAGPEVAGSARTVGRPVSGE